MSFKLSAIGEIFAIIAIAAVALGAIAYALAQIRNGRSRADNEFHGLLAGEVAALTTKIERVEADNKAKDSEISRLMGMVEQLGNENKSLRDLVMGEKVPAALAAALAEMSKQTIHAIERSNKRHLEIYSGLISTMEDEYLAPLKARLERRHEEDGPAYEGPEKRGEHGDRDGF